jgi:uncharacterized protein involved in exopolysaccharide biosynthesis
MYARRKTARDRLNPPDGEALPRVGQLAIGIEAPACDDDEISLFDIWRILRRHRSVVLGVTLVAALAAGAAALLMTPVYRAEVLLAPVTDLDDNQHFATPMGDFGSLAALAGIKLDHKDKKDESIATLRSMKFTEQFIEDNNLRPILFFRLWDRQHGRWKASVSAEDIPTPWDAYKKFSDSVRDVREDRSTGLVTLSVQWTDPAVAAQWANELVSSVNTSLREKAVDTSNKAIAYLQEQLARTTVVDLQQVLHRLIESEMKKIILANVNTEFAFRVIDPAVVPEEAFWPKALPLMVLGTLVGLMLGIFAALVLNARRGHVPDPE